MSESSTPSFPEARALGAQFPDEFLWGVGTAAYQVEGSVAADGRGESIWDRFGAQRGRIADGTTGAVASDHYRRWEQDIALLSGLGVNAYRFSIAWPRIQPTGTGRVNAAGLAFYDRLVERLCELEIAPVATLFHWDLPQAQEDRGGWLARETAERFGEYAAVVADALGDRVKDWFTIIEPYILTRHAYILGEHAPGRTLSTGAAMPVLHHLLLGHGLATRAVRAAVRDARIGLTTHPSPATAASQASEDVEALEIFNALRNWSVTDPVLLGRYPEALERLMDADSSAVDDGDLDIIRTPVDHLGLTYYHPSIVRAPSAGSREPFELVPLEGHPLTTMEWPIVPDGLTETLRLLKGRYGAALPPLVITENGASFPDEIDQGGAVRDGERIAFLDAHLRALRAGMASGVRVNGYFVWSFLDHFEWDLGHTKRWGLVHVDWETQERSPKESAAWYRDVVAGWRGASTSSC